MIQRQNKVNYRDLFSGLDDLSDIFTRFTGECLTGTACDTSKNVRRYVNSIGIPAEIEEKDDRYIIELELPRYKKDEIDVSLSENVLTIKTKQPEIVIDSADKPKQKLKPILERSFKLKKLVSPEDIKAKLLDGILTLELIFDKKYLSQKISIA